MSGVLRHARLLGLFLKSSLLTQLEYRASFVTDVLLLLCNVAAVVFTNTVFFTHRDQVGGWSLNAALIVVGLWLLVGGLISAVLKPNVERIIQMIREGTLDFTLVKPVNSQFLVSARHVNFVALFETVSGIIVAGIGLRGLGVMPSLPHVLAFVLMLLCAITMVYAIWLVMATTSFWFVKIGNLTELFNVIYDTGRFPISTFKGAIRIGLTFIVPIAFITTFPAEAMLGVLQLQWLLVAVVMAGALFAFSAWFWRRAVLGYSSASS